MTPDDVFAMTSQMLDRFIDEQPDGTIHDYVTWRGQSDSIDAQVVTWCRYCPAEASGVVRWVLGDEPCCARCAARLGLPLVSD
jgi:hypothetical protein